MATAEPQSNSQLRWYDAYPAARNNLPPTISRQELRKWIIEGKQPGKDFVLVDLRREDHEGGTIRGSINLPAQSLYPSLPTLYSLFKGAGVKTVIWYCTTSRGRGNRAAAWFNDYINDQGDPEIQSVSLFEGILGWATAGKEFTHLIDEYVEEVWQRPDPADNVEH